MSGSQWVRSVMPRWPALSALPLLLLLVGAAGETSAYFADWGVIGGRPQEPTCVDIPQNMPLCSGIDYNKMRLPNLLEHDTLKEAQQQAGYWVPLLNLRCHPNTQLFLCSLFTPVCLESPIYPCRSLCEAVRSGCESRMQTYSFPWPEMLNCDKFPLDNDMCITVQHTGTPGPDGECPACSPVETYENILDNYCRADLVVKTRVKKQRRSQLVVKKSRRVYKSKPLEEDRRAIRRLRFSLTEEANCCTIPASRKPYLIMARREGAVFIPTFVMPFKKSKPLRKALKVFRHGLNCSDPNLITSNLEPTSLPGESQQNPRQSGRRKGRSKKCLKECRKTCNKRCRKNRGDICKKNCNKNCRKNCRSNQNSRGRNRKGGSNQNRSRPNGNQRPIPGVLSPDDIASEISNFVPANFDHPISSQEGNPNIQEAAHGEEE
ncbi:secreted frizzled-related protein 5-like isoform X2 [Homarus americanus]|uniref:secreted frizzled-related protein 5-like isoform X2 n=1 Tax=Homarus americanus TaxID=6706 RepID=UPI001C45F80E|nr:secreted frizzled-related protein 5-like isoform X2 [Homarus americanus]